MNAAPSPQRTAALALVIVCAVLAFLALLAFPSSILDPSVDGSWSGAFAYFFTHRLHAGTDYIFTYGPLGFLMSAYFDPQTFWIRWAYEILVKGYVVVETIRIASLGRSESASRPGWPVAILLAIVAVTFAFSIHPAYTYLSDAFAYVLLLILAVAPMLDTKFSRVRGAVTLILVSLLSLEKATLILLAVPVVALCALRIASQNKDGNAVIRTLSQPLLLFPVIWLALWLLAGQTLGNIAPYFVGSLSVASGYNEAMAFTEVIYRNSALPLAVAIGSLGCLLAALALQAIALPRTRREGVSGALFLLTVALIALMSWKHGFTRGGNHTILYFLVVAFAAPLLLVALPGGSKSLARNVLLMLAATGATFGSLYGNDGWFHRDDDQKPILSGLSTLVNPTGSYKAYETLLHGNQAAGALPRIRAAVGNATVDIWSYEQAMLLLNGMNYRPHPSFQGYSDYTEYLQQRDLEFWQSDGAPDYLVYKPETIDNRYPTLDGGPAFVAMLERYEPLFGEQGFLLMKRRPLSFPVSALQSARDTAPVQTAKIGDWIPIPPAPPSTIEMVAIDFSQSPAGSLRALAYKPADVSLEAGMTGITKPASFRLLRTMAAQGFLLNPFIASPQQAVALYLKRPQPPLDRLRIVLPPGAQSDFDAGIRVRFYTIPFAPLGAASGNSGDAH